MAKNPEFEKVDTPEGFSYRFQGLFFRAPDKRVHEVYRDYAAATTTIHIYCTCTPFSFPHVYRSVKDVVFVDGPVTCLECLANA